MVVVVMVLPIPASSSSSFPLGLLLQRSKNHVKVRKRKDVFGERFHLNFLISSTHVNTALVESRERVRRKRKKEKEIRMEETSVGGGGYGTRLRSGRVLNNSDDENVSAGGFSSAADAKAALLSSGGGGQGGASKKITFTEENERLLSRGIQAVFERWTALTMAVVNEWGGFQSKEKAQSLREETLEFLLKDSKKGDSIEDFLYDCIAEDFNVQLEDESHEEVGKVLRAMFEECGRGESSLVEKIEMQKLPKEAMELRDAIREADMRNEGFKMAGVDEEMDDGDESESSSGEVMDDEGEGDAEELAAGLKGMGKKKNEPDADGWTTV